MPEVPIQGGEMRAEDGEASAELARLLEAMGCPAGQCSALAAQLRRRATQLAAAKGRTEAEALAHLLSLMRQGWAARERGL